MLPALPETPSWIQAYDLFGLYWPEHLWQAIADHTIQYALLQGAREEVSRSDQDERPWHRADAQETKVFIGLFLHMGIYHSPKI